MLMNILLQSVVALDTVRVSAAVRSPDFDGRADSAEYGTATLTLTRPGGTVSLWLRRDGPWTYVAAAIEDRTFYWGDDLVISLDTRGDRASAPQHDDFQWYFRRTLDSSVVSRGEAGKWRAPRGDPDWRLGAERAGGGWEVASINGVGGWSVEFRLDSAYFTQAGEGTPGMAFRVYDNDPHGWHPWPRPPGIKHPTDVEQRPSLWAAVLLPTGRR